MKQCGKTGEPPLVQCVGERICRSCAKKNLLELLDKVLHADLGCDPIIIRSVAAQAIEVVGKL